ncbi:hypothetical protein BV25DRAFT_1911794 [Artomyces pyxidatus]|uniref:Uncharacterized protein n=1 Tax=Artomyces pyxidatus TaxID=48021 RepID=A0ACB8THL6_9AGAM|nr:hypothetical protein BV25DRAFT_1911794 [Artomyces pyxidatus]
MPLDLPAFVPPLSPTFSERLRREHIGREYTGEWYADEQQQFYTVNVPPMTFPMVHPAEHCVPFIVNIEVHVHPGCHVATHSPLPGGPVKTTHESWIGGPPKEPADPHRSPLRYQQELEERQAMALDTGSHRAWTVGASSSIHWDSDDSQAGRFQCNSRSASGTSSPRTIRSSYSSRSSHSRGVSSRHSPLSKRSRRSSDDESLILDSADPFKHSLKRRRLSGDHDVGRRR